jgi:hypothetical protein
VESIKALTLPDEDGIAADKMFKDKAKRSSTRKHVALSPSMLLRLP